MDFADLKLSKVWHEKNRLSVQTSGHEIVFATSIDSLEAQQPVRNSNELKVAPHRSSGPRLKAYG
jgi:hypothetical protein